MINLEIILAKNVLYNVYLYVFIQAALSREVYLNAQINVFELNLLS